MVAFEKKAHRQVSHAVNNSFIAEVWNNTETGIIVCGLLKGVIARSKCVYFSHCLSFNTLQTNQRNVPPEYSQTSDIDIFSNGKIQPISNVLKSNLPINR